MCCEALLVVKYRQGRFVYENAFEKCCSIHMTITTERSFPPNLRLWIRGHVVQTTVACFHAHPRTSEGTHRPNVLICSISPWEESSRFQQFSLHNSVCVSSFNSAMIIKPWLSPVWLNVQKGRSIVKFKEAGLVWQVWQCAFHNMLHCSEMHLISTFAPLWISQLKFATYKLFVGR